MRAYDTSAPEPRSALDLRLRTLARKELVQQCMNLHLGLQTTGPHLLVASIYPADNSLNIPQSTTSLSFKLRDHQSLPLTYTVTTSPNIGSTSGSINSGTIQLEHNHFPI